MYVCVRMCELALIIAVKFEMRLERTATPSITLSPLFSIQLEMSAETDVRKMPYSQLSISDDVGLSLCNHTYKIS